MAPRRSLAGLAAVVAVAPVWVAAQNTPDCATLVTNLNACAPPATTSFANGVTAMNSCLCTAAIQAQYTACLTSSQATNPALTGVPIDGLNFGPTTALVSICNFFATDVQAATAAGIADSDAALTAFTEAVNANPAPPRRATVAANGGGDGLAGTDYLGTAVVNAAAASPLGLTLQGILGFPTSVVVLTSAATSSSPAPTTAAPTTDTAVASTTDLSAASSSAPTATDGTALPGQPAQSKAPNVFTGEAASGKKASGVMMLAALGAAIML